MTYEEKETINKLISTIEAHLARLYRHYRLNDELLYGEKMTELDEQNMLAETLLDIGHLKELLRYIK